MARLGKQRARAMIRYMPGFHMQHMEKNSVEGPYFYFLINFCLHINFKSNKLWGFVGQGMEIASRIYPPVEVRAHESISWSLEE